VDSPFRIEALVTTKVSFASQQNSVPVLRELTIINEGDDDLKGIELTASSAPAFFTNGLWRIAQVSAGQRYRVPNLDLQMDAGALARLNEVEKGSIQFVLRKGENELASLSVPVELLARNEWGGMGSFPELAAAFVQPNDPAVQHLLGKAIDVLRLHGKEPALVGYKRGKKGVWDQLTALWNAICSQQIGYVLPPASFEQTGQKVRHPSQVIETGIGTCLDLTMLFASCMEQCSLNPLLVFTDDHAFVGCWLADETFSTAVADDVTALRKRLHLQELLLFETTLAAQQKDGVPSFKWSCERGEAQIAEEKEHSFHLAVDVHRARMQRILPLALAEVVEPQRPSEEPSTQVFEPEFDDAPEFIIDNDCIETVEEKGPLTRLERWQRRLLDLSLRNNLINFRASKRVVELIAPDPGTLEDMLASGYRFRILPGIEQQEGDPRQYSIYEDRHEEDLIKSHALDALERHQLLAPLPQQELVGRLLELYRSARSALEEGGANTLFLALGFLSWRPKDRDKSCKAPLVLVPVKLERKSVQSGFFLSLHDDEPRFNLTLIEMLRKDFEISELDVFEKDLPKDGKGLDIDLIWRSVQKAIKDIPAWEVSRTVSLGLFSFAKYLMWKDLVDHTDALKESPVVRHLLDTPSERYRDGVNFLDPRELDTKLPAENVYCPLPVDSSQLAAVATAAQGKDFVLIGPPGTGKSQTISNMIAQCLAEGKTVLFVAEKTAALNVVYRRLKDIGLGEFCLELHSHKARKLEVLGQLRNASQASGDSIEDRWNLETMRLTDLRDKLNEYVETVHRSYPNGLNAFQAIGMVVGHTEVPLVNLCWPSPRTHDLVALTRLRDIVTRIGLHGSTARSLEATSLRKIKRLEWSPVWVAELVDAARGLATICTQLESAAAALLKVTGIPALPLDLKGRDGLEGLSGLLPKAACRDYRFVLRPDAPGLFARLREGVALLKEHKEHSGLLSVAYHSEAFQLDHANLESIWQLASTAWIPRLKEAFDLYHEYGEKAGRLSIPYKSDAYDLDFSTLQATWEQSKSSWWLRRVTLEKRVRKALLGVSKGKIEPDCEGDLAALAAMRKIQNRLEALEPLGEEATLLWSGTPTLPAKKCAAFHEAVHHAMAHLADVPDSPVTLAGVLKHLFGGGEPSTIPQTSSTVFLSNQSDPAFLLRNHVIGTLQGVAEVNGGAIPDPEKDLPALASMRSQRDRIASYDDLRDRTAGFWAGIGTDVQEISLAATFYENLQTAIVRFVDRPETLLSLNTALEFLLGPGNILLSQQGGADEAMATYIAVLEKFKLKANTIARLSEDTEADWLHGDLTSITDTCQGIVVQQSSIHEWCAWLRVKNEACAEGLVPLVEVVTSGLVETEKISEAFEVNYCRWWLIAASEELPVMRSFVAIEHERKICDFQALDKSLRELSRQCIRMRLRSGNLEDDNGAEREWGVLKREMEKKKRHMPVRQLIKAIPTVLTQLTPCLLMSPLSIAQYLAPAMRLFDLIIFDEASQIPVWDAIGAMARGRHVVVVGDPKQLPPTNFFNRSEDEQADDEVVQEADMESILDECLGSNLPELQLRWHYRSRHESLITFSNHRYYEGDLVTFPSPHSEDQAVSYNHVVGVYQRGGARTNPLEARAVVSNIVSRLMDPAFVAEGLSIGVVTFNSEQQRLIDDMLEAERRKNGSLERFFDDDLQEPLFVKNLESVQGDERDIVYFSTTYGPDQTGRVSMNFGPLNKDGGERRLNVAVTRARHELRVFTSLLPDQIDITRTNAVGVKDLKLFLDFAKRGPRAFLEEIHGNGGDFESPLEKAVAAALCQKGWQVHPQIGVSCFRIDLGVLDPDLPGRYLAAVECDGATYHRSATARDRDKLRERVLRGLGWEVLRVWSTEWWTSRERAVGRLHEQLTRLLSAARIRRAEKTEEPKQAVQVQDKLKPSTENEELPIRGQTVVETREKRKGYSVEQSGLGQLRANFEKKPVVASPAHPQKSQVINPDSIHQKPVPEHPLRGKEVEKKEKDPDIPKISPFRQPVDYRSVADPFSETVMTLLPDDRKHCPARHDRMALLFGMYGPYLKCSKCDEMGEIPYQTLFETLSKLQSPCEKCGWPMLRVLPGKVLAGCSHCKHTEPWKVLAIRLRHK
jgi:very-short-patch-repair endonuclease